jgi:cytochrome c peroxidase
MLSRPTLTSAYDWGLPNWLPLPIVPTDNPMSLAKVELGRYLFYEKRLSINGEFSCATCHQQSLAFTDGKSIPTGATGEKHPRSSQSLANVAYLPVLTWANPLLTNLEQQTLLPLLGENPVEMGMAGLEKQILSWMKQDARYQTLFRRAFATPTDPISLKTLSQAIAAFERTLISVDSPYDRYRYGGDPKAISVSAKRGERLFQSDRLACAQCHRGFNFTDSIKHQNLAIEQIHFYNTGLYNIDGKGTYPSPNTGIHEVTENPQDMGRFRVPTLRNIALTHPYMHDGSIPTLEAVIDHYAAGGRTLAQGLYAGIGSANPYKSRLIQGFSLTVQEKQDLLAFLESLTDLTFIQDPRFSDPNAESANDQDPNLSLNIGDANLSP